MSRLQSDFDVLKTTTKVAEAEALAQDRTLVTHGIVKESRVDILFEIERPQDIFDIRSVADRRVIRVKVHSVAKPNINRSTVIRVNNRSQSEMARACEFAAAAIGEQLCALYGDKFDPSELAKKGRQHFNELCAHLARAAATSEAKG